MTFKTQYEDTPFSPPKLEVSGMSVSGEATTTTTMSLTEMAAKPVVPEVPDVVLPKTWDQIREERNTLIAGTDWCVLPDAPITEAMKAQMIAYRQALRDITKSFDDPVRVMFPLNPMVREAMIKQYNITVGERTSPPGFGWADANATTQANTASDANTASTANTTTTA